MLIGLGCTQSFSYLTDSGERGMNPVAMTIINPRKEYWPSRGSNQRPPILKSATLPTELWGSAHHVQDQTVISQSVTNAILYYLCIAFKYYRCLCGLCRSRSGYT